MTKLEVLDSGTIDRQDSAFPTLVRLNNGNIICGFNVGGGCHATGGTDWARSTDGGQTWTLEGTILPRTTNPNTSNHLRLSKMANDVVLAYGERIHYPDGAETETGFERKGFGHDRNEPIFCQSTDGCRTWSAAQVIPMSYECQLEISNPIVVLADGRWLAPTALLPSRERFGEQVLAFESEDEGRTWPSTRTVMEDPDKKKGYFEQKLIELEPSKVMAVAWTVTLGDYQDLQNHFCLSHDGGRTWSTPMPTGIQGQTMTPTWLGGNRLLVTYNKRAGRQAVMMAVVSFTETDWHVEFEDVLWDARANYTRASDAETGIDELSAFQFGLPSAMRVDEKSFLAVHWCVEDGVSGIRWTRLRMC